MAVFQIYVNGEMISRVGGNNYAEEIYRKAVALCQFINGTCELVNETTNQRINSFDNAILYSKINTEKKKERKYNK